MLASRTSKVGHRIRMGRNWEMSVECVGAAMVVEVGELAALT